MNGFCSGAGWLINVLLKINGYAGKRNRHPGNVSAPMNAGTMKFTSHMMVTATGIASGMVWMAGNNRRANCHLTPISMNEKVGTMESQSNMTDMPMVNIIQLLDNPTKRKTIQY